MRKLLLGVGLLVAGRYLARRSPTGWRRFTSPQALLVSMLASAANEMLRKHEARKAPAAPAPSA